MASKARVSAIEAGIRQFESGQRQLKASIEKNVKRLRKLAENAESEQKKEHYTKLALRNLTIGTEQLRKLNAQIAKLKDSS